MSERNFVGSDTRAFAIGLGILVMAEALFLPRTVTPLPPPDYVPIRTATMSVMGPATTIWCPGATAAEIRILPAKERNVTAVWAIPGTVEQCAHDPNRRPPHG